MWELAVPLISVESCVWFSYQDLEFSPFVTIVRPSSPVLSFGLRGEGMSEVTPYVVNNPSTLLNTFHAWDDELASVVLIFSPSFTFYCPSLFQGPGRIITFYELLLGCSSSFFLGHFRLTLVHKDSDYSQRLETEVAGREVQILNDVIIPGRQ